MIIMKKYFKLIRVKHWIKNLLVFLPVVCAKMVTTKSIGIILIGFLSFCLASSFIYIINDIKDINVDRLHPRKKLRPLASGEVSVKAGTFIAIALLILSFVISFIASGKILSAPTYFLLSYVIINIFYSFGMKNIAIVDVALLASGFVLRVCYGASLLDIEVSNWLFLTIMTSSLFLGLGKRKKELINNKNTRNSLQNYTEPFLNYFQYIFLGCMFIFYSLWAIEQTNKYLIITVPLLILIFMKYCLILETSKEGDPTTILYSDKVLLVLCFLYLIVMGLFMVVL